MSEIQKQQEVDQKNYQFRIRLEQLQEDQLAIRKEQRYIEEQQEEFFQLQQQEQAAYDFVLGTVKQRSEPFLKKEEMRVFIFLQKSPTRI
ncbi:hypothetical protein [Enterococcus ureasiticus]|uniref:Uncharacterized protein n=1 Tax=Enterococcus ureasiticus TaxID=903984 RepID=A0A1E5GL92_9ENTE|nr:hypothetical protein [Enterococcus ureasiticus]OEG13447.1 hypothetical protein BCR21_00185 [Enterococcus ureasiticus]